MDVIEIKGAYFGDKTFPSLNNLLTEYGKTPLAGGRMKKKYQSICIRFIRTHLKGKKYSKAIILHYHFYEPRKGQKRDVMNVFSFFDKVFEDALVELKTIKDDNPAIVLNTTHDFHYTDKVPYVVVEIEEVDTDNG